MKWLENEFYTHHYYNEENGLVIGLVHKFGTQNTIYISKIIKQNNELMLGQYINQDFAKKAVEKFWQIESQIVLENES